MSNGQAQMKLSVHPIIWTDGQRLYRLKQIQVIGEYAHEILHYFSVVSGNTIHKIVLFQYNKRTNLATNQY